MLEAEYEEQVFYFNGDFSSFLTSKSISPNWIQLEGTPKISIEEFRIEFSFPDSNLIIDTFAKLSQDNGNYYLKFKDINHNDVLEIKKYIAKKVNYSRKKLSESTYEI